MGRAARPLHDAGNHRSIEPRSDLQAARRSSLNHRPNSPESIKIDAALTPQLGHDPLPGTRAVATRRLPAAYFNSISAGAIVGSRSGSTRTMRGSFTESAFQP